MPLPIAEVGVQHIIQRVAGIPKVRKFLETLGFVPGSPVTIISENNGNLIVRIKDTRVAVSKEMAMKIIV